jgi:hypothetical protein
LGVILILLDFLDIHHFVTIDISSLIPIFCFCSFFIYYWFNCLMKFVAKCNQTNMWNIMVISSLCFVVMINSMFNDSKYFYIFENLFYILMIEKFWFLCVLSYLPLFLILHYIKKELKLFFIFIPCLNIA